MRNLFTPKRLLLLGIGFIFGVLALAAFRFATFKDDTVHYHANFALFIDGNRDEFKSPLFYEEVQLCGGDQDNPRGRAHMHSNESYNVHVHDSAVTWSQFFDNLGYSLSNQAVGTTDSVFVNEEDGHRLSFILNGKQVTSVANQVISDKDVLLVSYGDADEAALQAQYKTIPHTAAKLDASKDPASCSGGEKAGFTDRLKDAFGIEAKPASHSH